MASPFGVSIALLSVLLTDGVTGGGIPSLSLSLPPGLGVLGIGAAGGMAEASFGTALLAGGVPLTLVVMCMAGAVAVFPDA